MEERRSFGPRRGGFGGRDRFPPKPVEIGKEYEVEFRKQAAEEKASPESKA